MARHHNKTLATALGLFLGGVGAHRFYLRGSVDKLGLLHLMALPACGMLVGLAPHADPYYKLLPLLLSSIAACIETLVLGLKSDEKFDAEYNAGSGRQSDSSWPLALLLVLTLGVGATALIAAISRLFDLLYTGGAYG